MFYTVRFPPLDHHPYHVRDNEFTNCRDQHALALPIFLFLISDVKRGLKALSRDEVLSTPGTLLSQLPIPASILDRIPIDSIVVKPIYVILLMNLATQLVCVYGVNRLTSVRPPRRLIRTQIMI